MTNPNLTHLILILDRSGSMGDHNKAREAEKGVRALLAEQIALPGQLEVTVARFDDRYELLTTAQPAERVDPNHLRIVPRGMTALFDAVGKTVESVGRLLATRRESDRPGRVTVLVATDGLENASLLFDNAGLKALIDRQTNTYGWEFMFMGTSQEAVVQAVSAGFTNDMSYASSDTAAGVSSSYTLASSSLTRARTKGARVEITDDDRASLA